MVKWLCTSILVVFGSAAVGCGSDDSTAGSERIRVEMQDIAFAPETLTVRAGEPVTFAFENVGKVDHEAIIGDESVQDDHEREMSGQDEGHGGSGHSSTTGGDTGHDADPDTPALTLAPGESGELVHEFDASDDGIIIGCHEPDHYAAGMKIDVQVEA